MVHCSVQTKVLMWELMTEHLTGNKLVLWKELKLALKMVLVMVERLVLMKVLALVLATVNMKENKTVQSLEEM